MACSGVLNSITCRIKTNQFLQQPLTKAALFVIGVLFASGAVASHFAGFGFPGIVAFSLMSAACMALYAICRVGNENVKRLNADDNDTEKTETTKSLEQLSDNELVRNISLLKNAGGQNVAILNQEVVSRIKKRLSGEEEMEVANALRPLFDAAKNDQSTLKTLIELAIRDCGHPPSFVTSVLEKLIDQNILYESLKAVIKDVKCITRSCVTVCHEENDIGAFCVDVDFNTIVGRNDQKAMPDSLVRALGDCIQSSAKEAWGWVCVRIKQDDECCLSVSMIAPLLPYLNNIPKLVELSLSIKEGFRDEHVDALLEIIRTNSHLIRLECNDSGMTDEKRGEFDTKCQEIFKTHEISVGQPLTAQVKNEKIASTVKKLGQMSNLELVKEMSPFPSGVVLNPNPQTTEELIWAEIENRMESIFANSKSTNCVIEELRPLFSLVSNDSSKLETLAWLTIQGSGYLSSTASVLEALKIEESILNTYLGEHIEKYGITREITSLPFSDVLKCNVLKLVLKADVILGSAFDESNIIPESLKGAVGCLIQRVANTMIEDLKKEKREKGIIGKKSPRGIIVAIEPFRNLSASTIAFVLPYLIELPGLVGLELDSFYDSFRAEHAEELLNVMKKNPNLLNVAFRLESVSSEKLEEFNCESKKVGDRKVKPDFIEELLTEAI